MQDLWLQYDYHTGTMTYRWDKNVDRKESFTYDALNRLTGSVVQSITDAGVVTGTVSTTPYTYDGTLGQTRGNLTVKSDVGQLQYGWHNVIGAMNINYPTPPDAPPAVISQEDQDITYTAFEKTETITEDVSSDTYELTYRYGPDYQRSVSTLKKNSLVNTQRWYVGAYEKQVRIVSGVSYTQEIHYIPGGDGLCAILVKEGGVVTTNVVYKDHLGSIVKLTRPSGSSFITVAQQSFDAWGRQRDPATWAYSTTLPALPTWLYRGYTGHEHVEPFVLINMNGRMYDPVNGRMLAPDNYAQGALNSQGYNRYTYALNNPLVHTDPTGEFLIPMLVGGLLNLAYQGLTTGFDNPGQAFGAFAVGAFAGLAGAGAGTFATGVVGGSALGFGNGLVVGAFSGAASGVVGEFGNALNRGAGLDDSMQAGSKGFVSGAWMGGVTGGIVNGIGAKLKGARFWDGVRVSNQTTAQTPGMEAFGGRGSMDCMTGSCQSIEGSFGGTLDPDALRDFLLPGSNPDIDGLPWGPTIKYFSTLKGHLPEEIVDIAEIADYMNRGGRVILGTNYFNGHAVAVRSVIQRTLVFPNGNSMTKTLFDVMNPSFGGGFGTIPASRVMQNYMYVIWQGLTAP